MPYVLVCPACEWEVHPPESAYTALCCACVYMGEYVPLQRVDTGLLP